LRLCPVNDIPVFTVLFSVTNITNANLITTAMPQEKGLTNSMSNALKTPRTELSTEVGTYDTNIHMTTPLPAMAKKKKKQYRKPKP